MPTVKEAAEFLEVSVRQVYDWLEEGVLSPYYRMAGTTIRIDKDVIEKFKEKSKCQSSGKKGRTKIKAVGVTNLTASSTESGSALRDFFRKAGLDPERKRSRGKKQQGSTLKLVASSSQDER